MQYTYLGKSNLKVSKICLGTMHFGSATSEEDAFHIMDDALEMGINFFDTANVYGRSGGRGRTEEVIGNWFQQGGSRREQVVLATKVFGSMPEDYAPNDAGGISAYKVHAHVADSLRRLQTDHIDLYQVHHIDRRITAEEYWGAFERLVDRGDVLYLGTSNFPGWGLVKHQMQALQRGSMGLVSEQTMYSLLCRYPELEVFPAAQEMGIGILAYMPLAGGLLSGKAHLTPAGSRTREVEEEYGIDLDENRQLGDFADLCREIGEAGHIVAIAWTLANPAINSAIVGVRTRAHLNGLARASELELDEASMQRLNEIFDINKGRRLRPGQAPEAYAW